MASERVTVRARMRTGVACALLAGAMAAAHAAPSGDDARRTAFMARDDVEAGLRTLKILVMERLGGADDAHPDDRCWDGVRRLLEKTPDAGDDAQMDACMSAAAASFEGKGITYVHRSPQRKDVGPAGVGLVIRAGKDGLFDADDVIPGSPAAVAGIEAGGRLLAVNDESVAGKTIDAVVRQLRGAAGTPVTVTVLPALADAATARPRPVSLVRAVYTLPQVFGVPLRQAWYLDLRDLGAGLDNRDRQDDVERIAKAARALLQPDTRIVLDLRGNTGGLARVAADIDAVFVDGNADRLLNFNDEGVDSVPARAPATGRLLQGHPMVVLVDGDTGGGAAWLAESLHRHAGALLVGRPTSPIHGARLGAFLDATPGARFEVPDSDLFVAEGLLVEGQALAPDVVLDDARMTPKRMGRAPTWLQAWLDDDMPAAIARRDAAHRATPRVASAADRADGQRLCTGGASMTLPAGFPHAVLDSSGTFVRSKSWQLTIASAEDTTLFTHAQTRSDIAQRTAAERQDLADLARKPSTAEARTAIAVQKQDLVDSVKQLASLKEWDTGVPGARVFADPRSMWLRWEHDGFAHRLVPQNLPAGMTVRARVALLSELARHLSASPGPGVAGLCMPGGFLALDEPVLKASGRANWSLGEQGKAGSVDFRFRRGEPGGAGAGESERDLDAGAATSDKQWLLERPDLSKPTWPRLAADTLGGLEAITRRSEALSEAVGPCRVLRTASRAPLVSEPPAAMQAGADFCAASGARADQLERDWRAALASAAFPLVDAPTLGSARVK